MSHHQHHHNSNTHVDEKTRAKLEKQEKRDRQSEHFFRRVLHVLERIIAIIALFALMGALAVELYAMWVDKAAYFTDVNHMLHNLLNIVVGLEFVRMLIDTTPANILEVLTVAITRHVVLSHDDPWSNMACIACIAGLFAIRRYLIRRSELQSEMVETE